MISVTLKLPLQFWDKYSLPWPADFDLTSARGLSSIGRSMVKVLKWRNNLEKKMFCVRMSRDASNMMPMMMMPVQ